MINILSNAFNKISNVVGKIKKFGSSVGKRIHNFTSYLTPEASDIPNLTGLSRTLAIISNIAYDTKRPFNIDGYQLDESLSTPLVAVYKNNSTIILGFRGTSKFEDLKTDYQILKGTSNDPQFREAEQIYQRVKSLHPNLNIIATGHSKGGSLALYLNRLHNIKAEVFNPGIGLSESNPNSNNATLHIIKGDPISSLAGIKNIGIVKTYKSIYSDNALKAHLMSNFI